MTLDLSSEERTLLIQLLEIEIEDLGHEVHHTDAREYRDELKHRRQTLEQLLDRIVKLGSA